MIQMGGVYTTFCHREGILLQKYAIEMGGVSRYFFTCIGVRGRFDSPESGGFGGPVWDTEAGVCIPMNQGGCCGFEPATAALLSKAAVAEPLHCYALDRHFARSTGNFGCVPA